MFKSHDFQKNLLDWYDRHKRDLPWRAMNGESADPYHVWLSEIMLQQTTVPTVIPFFQKFLALWPSLSSFAAADREDVLKEWAGLGYYARARNLHKCAAVVTDDYKGSFPDTEKELLLLPGIGPYTAAAISAIAFGKQAIVIDGNVERVTARIFAILTPLKESKAEIKRKAAILYEEVNRPGDFAQGLMDLASAICIPKKPRCGICPVSAFCEAFKQNLQDQIPAKALKKTKPVRTGKVFWIENSKGQVLLERREENRMLGGMLGFPTTNWDGKPARSISQAVEKKLKYIGDVYHSFTHFDLKLEIWQGMNNDTRTEQTGFLFLPRADIAQAGLPTLFKKVTKVIPADDK